MELKGKMDVPGVGAVDKRVVLGIGGAAAVFLGWRWYQARSGASYDPEAQAVDPGMEDGSEVLPSVAGAVRPDNDYGLPAGDVSTDGGGGFRGTTNSQWTEYVTGKLTASESWTYTAIVTALGKYVKGRPLSSAEQDIVQAAIAVAGYPPESPSLPVVPGGNTPITVAPSGVRVTATGDTWVNLAWQPVAGARDYRVYRSGAGTSAQVAGAGSTSVYGLQPNTTYSFQVAAVSLGGEVGPKSSAVSGKTKAAALKAPSGVRVSAVASTAATVSWGKVPGAQLYHVYLNGILKGSPDGTASSFRLSGLRKKTKYTVTVRADTTTQPEGPASRPVAFTTKS